MMQLAVVESWIEAPLKQFVSDAGAELALLLHPSGQVLAQHGFARAVDVMSACALAAGIHASAGRARASSWTGSPSAGCTMWVESVRYF